MSSVAKGDSLEIAIERLLNGEITAGRFWAKKAHCRVFRKKGYYSRDRESKIIFDVTIEIYLPNAAEYSLLVLVECKNEQRNVGVGQVEEFFTKAQQVAAAGVKAIVASTASFDPGARAFAKSKGMGLIRYFDSTDFKWELKRSPSGSARGTHASESALVEGGLSREDFRSTTFDLYLQSPTRYTNSLWDFFEDIARDAGLTAADSNRIANRKEMLSSQVPFIEKDLLEAQAADVLIDIGYARGPVSLEAICSLEMERCGLVVKTGVRQSVSAVGAPLLGRIRFEPLEIHVFTQAEPNSGRERFTLAHELAHHLLRHGQHMTSEACDEYDFVLNRRGVSRGTDIARMEFQANFFASCLLMPRSMFIEDFVRVMGNLDLVDRGFGALYVDNQPCNLQSYGKATGHLMDKYGVSRAAVKVRLEGLGLLRDDRAAPGLHALQDALGWEFGGWEDRAELEPELDGAHSS